MNLGRIVQPIQYGTMFSFLRPGFLSQPPQKQHQKRIQQVFKTETSFISTGLFQKKLSSFAYHQDGLVFTIYIFIYRVIGSHNSTYRVKITPSEMHWFSTIWPFIGGPIVTPSSQKPSRKYSFLAGIKRPVPKMVIGTIGTFARFAMDTGPRLNFLGVWLLFHVWKKKHKRKNRKEVRPFIQKPPGK